MSLINNLERFLFPQAGIGKLVSRLTEVAAETGPLHYVPIVDELIDLPVVCTPLKFTSEKHAESVCKTLNERLKSAAATLKEPKHFDCVPFEDNPSGGIAFRRSDRGLFPFQRLYKHLLQVEKSLVQAGSEIFR